MIAETDNEADLAIHRLLESDHYLDFRQNRLPQKITREIDAWKLVQESRGNYTRDTLDQIFDTVDLEGNERWFGSLLAAPARNLIFSANPSLINQWFEELLFSGKVANDALYTCLTKLKIKGASKGLASLLLYLSSPEKYNIWIKKTTQGLYAIGYLDELGGKEWGANYGRFNNAAVAVRDRYKFQPREMDFVLTNLGKHFEPKKSNDKTKFPPHTESNGGHKAIQKGPVFGPHMNFRGLRHEPVNEQGVVFLFGMVAQELGYSVEALQAGYPDCQAKFRIRGGLWKQARIEFEFESRNFKTHGHDPNNCDVIVCWKHNWQDCPSNLKVVELSSIIKTLPTGE